MRSLLRPFPYSLTNRTFNTHSIGFITNRLATEYIFDRSDVVSFIGATVIGLLGNMYSRLFNGTAFTAMATGVLFLVPSGIAAAGGLAMTSGSGDSYNSG